MPARSLWNLIMQHRRLADRLTKPANFSDSPVLSPQSRHPYTRIPGQVLFATDRNSNPIIADNLTNIRQGDSDEAQDCYFLAALLAVAQRWPAIVTTLVHDNGDGTYSGAFHSRIDGKPGYYLATVNGDLPVDGGQVANNWVEHIAGKAVSWAAITEKLWAAVNGNSYAGIDGDALVGDREIPNALYAITGAVVVERDVPSLTFTQLAQDYSQGVVVVGTGEEPGPLEDDHAYAVVGVDSAAGTVTLGDPVGGTNTVNFAELTHSKVNQYFTKTQ